MWLQHLVFLCVKKKKRVLVPCDRGWHTSPSCLSVGGGWERGKRRSSWTWKTCNLTPAFSLPSFLFTSQTHRGLGVTFFVPRCFFSNWLIYVRLSLLPISCSLTRSAWLLFGFSVLELTGMPRLTANGSRHLWIDRTLSNMIPWRHHQDHCSNGLMSSRPD